MRKSIGIVLIIFVWFIAKFTYEDDCLNALNKLSYHAQQSAKITYVNMPPYNAPYYELFYNLSVFEPKIDSKLGER